jgi:predicted methyltransferase
MGKIIIGVFVLLLMGCGDTAEPPAEALEYETPGTPEQNVPADSAMVAEPPAADDREDAASKLERILADQPEEVQARYPHRRPAQTLQFFGIQPGMTVVEALPGGGWYSRILLPYLGSEGRLIGANYPPGIWTEFGSFDESFIESMQTWATDWPQQAQEWRGEGDAPVEAFVFGAMPEHLEGQADAVLLIRAMHNLARFDDAGGYLTTTLDDVHRVLKPGGIVGVVQHAARADMPDDWASGANAYLKEQYVIDRMTAAGFELEASSDINSNPADQHTIEDSVWRLPPSYRGSADDPEKRAAMDAIGESNRMTLLFRKPA